MIYLKVSLRRKTLETGRYPFGIGHMRILLGVGSSLAIITNEWQYATGWKLKPWLANLIKSTLLHLILVDARDRVRLNPSIDHMSCVIYVICHLCLVPNRKFSRIIVRRGSAAFPRLCCGEWKRKRMTCTKALGTVLMCVWFQRPYCMTSATCSLK